MADDFVPIKRPKPGDGEEELLQMQEEFNRKKLAPCAKLIKLHSQAPKENSSIAKKQSRFAQKRSIENQKKRISTSQGCGSLTNENSENLLEQNDIKKIDPINDYSELPINFVLGNIVERQLNFKEFKHSSNTKLEESSTGFPIPFASTEMQKDADTKESLFMHAISKEKSKRNQSNTNDEERLLLFKKSHVVSGPWAGEIHKENIERLKQMSNDEILAEQKHLKTMLDPKTIEFIKSMKNIKNKPNEHSVDACKKNTLSFNANMEVDGVQNSSSEETMTPMEEDERSEKTKNNLKSDSYKIDTDFGVIDEELPEPVVNITNEAEQKGWVHMDDVEPEKVKWMQDLPMDKDTNVQPPEEPYNARFDFNGTLLPFNDEKLTVDKGLHHHGEEPDRPGYSLQELLQLSRSAAQQQRCSAITILANILEKTHLGWYDRALQPPILTILNQKNILLLLRFSLDDSALPVVTAALQALRAFLFCETDEICLDKIFGLDGFDEPILKPVIEDVDDIESLKDHELAQFDTVAAAIRSDILLRIRFLLSEMQLPLSGITAALEILSRLARHSHETALNIACTSNLLDIIVKKCIPLSMNQPSQDWDVSKPYGCPLVAAVRLCRILIIYAGRPVVERLKNLQIIHSLLTYISSNASEQQVRLHIESLKLWRIFLHFGVETDSIVGTRLTLITQIKLLESTLDLGTASPLKCDYAAALVAIAKYDEPLKEHVARLLSKWTTQLSRISMPKWNEIVLISETLRCVDDVSFVDRAWIQKSKVFEQLSLSSNLLSDVELATDRDPSSLPTLAVMGFEGKLQPVMSQHSRIVFLTTVLELFSKFSCPEEIEQIINNSYIQNYLQRLKCTDWSLERSWFTRIEYSFLVTIIQSVNQLKLDSKVNDTVWKIAIKLISALPADCPMNVRDILVFSLAPERMNIRFLESGLENLDLNKKIKNVEGSDENYNLGIKLYEKYVSANGSWSNAAMPKDWVYLPLVEAYSRMRTDKSWRYADQLNILNFLKIEMVVPELTQNLSPNLRFSRMMLLYLCDTAFLYQPASELPQKIISEFVCANYKRLDLAGEVPGLNSFTDLFTALCENFVANSYGEDCFAQALLVFVAQRYEVHYRKLLWSEHAGVLSYCRLTSEKLIIPFEEYLYPLEKDTSLIEAYITALVRNTVRENQSPVPYTIAVHHSAMYLKDTSKLAVVMRSRIEKLLNDKTTRSIAEKLLNYEPPVLSMNK